MANEPVGTHSQSRITLVEGEPHRCEWRKVVSGDEDCPFEARMIMNARGERIGDVCWTHADEIMRIAGSTVAPAESRAGWALWMKDSAPLKFANRDRLWEGND